MGSVVAILAGLAPMSADGATRHGHRLAPESFRFVLDMEVTAPAGKTENNCGDSRLDSAHEPRQPVVGSPPRSRGTPKVGNRSGAIDSRQVSATTPEAAHADLANIPDQSCGADGLDRLLYRSDRNIPGSVCLHRAVACSTPRGALRCERSTRARSGQRSKFAKRSPGIRRLNTCCAIEIRSTEKTLRPSPPVWGSKK